MKHSEAKDIAADILHQGGGTYIYSGALAGATFRPYTKGGLLVGGFVESDVIDREAFSSDHVEAFVRKHAEKLAYGYMLGGWADKGKVHLDLTMAFDRRDIDAAMWMARDNGEQAVYDADDGCTIFVEDWFAPQEPPVIAFRVAADGSEYEKDLS